MQDLFNKEKFVNCVCQLGKLTNHDTERGWGHENKNRKQTEPNRAVYENMVR